MSSDDETGGVTLPKCGLFAIYIDGHCVLPKGHVPESDHQNARGEQFTRGLTKEEGGHD